MRIYRQMDDTSKLRISNRLKGRSLTNSHKQAISDGMKAYWATIPNKPNENNENEKQFKDETCM